MPAGFRLYKALHDPRSGKGAEMAGGRWNAKGSSVIYTASSLSLACLEVLVHMTVNQLPDYVYVKALFPGGTMERFEPSVPFDEDVAKNFGTKWIQEKRSLVLEVPSSVIPQESNFLINPDHLHFHRIEWTESQPFQFDRRLLKSSRKA
jgi:RES domain-containing protein